MMYSTDSETGLTIISPRVYQLRQLQASEGSSIQDLRLDQRGLAPVTYMHHVSKIIEGNTESYRVRICRTCSGLPALLELGSYTDVESALLVNDVHELIHERTKQLHLLCVEDVKYISSIAIRRRGSPHDLLVTSVLQERLWKKTSTASATAKKMLKEASMRNSTGVGSTEIDSERETEGKSSSDLIVGTNAGNFSKYKTDENAFSNIFSFGTDESDAAIPFLDTNASSLSILSKGGQDDIVQVAQPNQISNSRFIPLRNNNMNNGLPHSGEFTNIAEEQRHGQSSDQSYIMEEHRNRPDVYHDIKSIHNGDCNSSIYENNRMRNDQHLPYLSLGDVFTNDYKGSGSFEQTHVPNMSHSSSQAQYRADRVVDQLKTNLTKYHTAFLQWGFFESSIDIDMMFLALSEFVATELTHGISSDNVRRNGSMVLSAEAKLRESWAMGNAPRSSLLSIISSVFPGNSIEMEIISKRVAYIIPQDTPPVSRFNDLFVQAVQGVQKVESEIRTRQFYDGPISDSILRSSSSIENVEVDKEGRELHNRKNNTSKAFHLKPETIISSFKDCEEFIRQSYNAVAYFDYSLRLCVWDGDLSGIQDAEIRLHGVYSQLENRFIAITHFLHVVTSANAAAVQFASDKRSAIAGEILPGGYVSTEISKRLEREEGDFDRDDEPDNGKTDGCSSVSDSDRPLIPKRKSSKDDQYHSYPENQNDNKKHDQNGFPHVEPSNRDQEVTGDATIEFKLATLLKKATMCVTYSILALTSAASIVWRVCGDTLSATSCIRACNNFLPILIENVSDPSILQQFMQRHLDLMTSTILYSGNSEKLGSGFGVLGPSMEGGRDFVFSRYKPSTLGMTEHESSHSCNADEPEVLFNPSNQCHTELRLLAFSLGGEIVKQSRRCFASFPRFLTGPAAMLHFEAAFRTYVAIFLTSLALEESDLLVKFGYTVEKLLSATNDVLSSLQERVNKHNCTLTSTHTIISLHSMAEACIVHSKRYADCGNIVFMIIRSCRIILWGCSSRFVLAKMLLEHIALEENKMLSSTDATEQAQHRSMEEDMADQLPINTFTAPVGTSVPKLAGSHSDILPYSSTVNSVSSQFGQQVSNMSNFYTSDNMVDANYNVQKPAAQIPKRPRGSDTTISTSRALRKKKKVNESANGAYNKYPQGLIEAEKNVNMSSTSSSYPYTHHPDYTFQAGQGGIIQNNHIIDDSNINNINNRMRREDFHPVYQQQPIHFQQFNSNQQQLSPSNFPIKYHQQSHYDQQIMPPSSSSAMNRNVMLGAGSDQTNGLRNSNVSKGQVLPLGATQSTSDISNYDPRIQRQLQGMYSGNSTNNFDSQQGGQVDVMMSRGPIMYPPDSLGSLNNTLAVPFHSNQANGSINNHANACHYQNYQDLSNTQEQNHHQWIEGDDPQRWMSQQNKLWMHQQLMNQQQQHEQQQL